MICMGGKELGSYWRQRGMGGRKVWEVGRQECMGGGKVWEVRKVGTYERYWQQGCIGGMDAWEVWKVWEGRYGRQGGMGCAGGMGGMRGMEVGSYRRQGDMGYTRNRRFMENFGGIFMWEVWEIREGWDVWEVLKYERQGCKDIGQEGWKVGRLEGREVGSNIQVLRKNMNSIITLYNY